MPMYEIVPHIRVLLEIGGVFLVTSSEAERSFSVLRRLETSLRNRMGRLSCLTGVIAHKSRNRTVLLGYIVTLIYYQASREDYINLVTVLCFVLVNLQL